VRSIVSSHGGTIGIENTDRKGRSGVRVTVSLPVA
jgi:hypothetical protein